MTSRTAAQDWIERFAALVRAELDAQGTNVEHNTTTDCVGGGIDDDENDTVAFYTYDSALTHESSCICGNAHVYCCIAAADDDERGVRIVELELNVIDGLLGNVNQRAQDIVRIFAIAALQSEPASINLK